MRLRMITGLLRTAVELYSLALVSVTVKTAYVVAGAAMLLDQAEDSSVGREAEEAVSRIVATLLEGGLDRLIAEVRHAFVVYFFVYFFSQHLLFFQGARRA